MTRARSSVPAVILSASLLLLTACASAPSSDREANNASNAPSSAKEQKQASNKQNHERHDQSAQASQSAALPAGQMGETQTVDGHSRVQSQRQVTRTETLTQNMPTIQERTIKADINRMTPNDFVALGMKEDTAQSIVDYRNQHGKFKSVDDLANVPQIDLAWLDQNRNRLGVG